MGRIRIILLARSAGFSISQTRTFLGNQPGIGVPSTRWRALAEGKIREMDALMARAAEIKTILQTSFRCGCATIADCERLLLNGVNPPQRVASPSSSRK